MVAVGICKQVTMEVGVEVAPNNFESLSSTASAGIPLEVQRENGDGDEQGWPLPVVAARVDSPDGAVDLPDDVPLPSVNNKQLADAIEVARSTTQRKLLPTRTLSCLLFEVKFGM